MPDDYGPGSYILLGLLWVLFWVLPACAALYLGYYLFSLPLRRQERARFFIDLLETGLKDGKSVEQTIVSISNSGDPSMGMRFHQLAGHLENGLSFRQALAFVPRFLPPQVTAMLAAGAEIGDFKKVFPACRQLLKDALSQMRGAVNYLVVLAFIVTPASLAVMSVVEIRVLPKCMDISANMTEGAPVPAALLFVSQNAPLFVLVQALLLLAVWLAAFLYVGGPRIHRLLDDIVSPFSEKIIYLLPWRRKRMHRDFSAMLAILLDAGLAEPEALSLAADCAGIGLFQQRAADARAALRQGAKLTEAVALLDDSAEFRWRLTHALGAGGGFVRAVAGWAEALDAQAFQQEQAAAQIVTTGLVLLNGVFVGLIVFGVFGMLISIINQGLLW